MQSSMAWRKEQGLTRFQFRLVIAHPPQLSHPKRDWRCIYYLLAIPSKLFQKFSFALY
tara:strand:- start:4515 stop:4688 length:174 start_codon:yes stop_codon:yes gene_type:complete